MILIIRHKIQGTLLSGRGGSGGEEMSSSKGKRHPFTALPILGELGYHSAVWPTKGSDLCQ